MAIDSSNTETVVKEATDSELTEFVLTSNKSDSRKQLAARLIDKEDGEPSVQESIDAISVYLDNNYASEVGLAQEFIDVLDNAGLDTSNFTVTNDRFRVSVTVDSSGNPLTRDALKALREAPFALVEVGADGTLYFDDTNVLESAVDVGVEVN